MRIEFYTETMTKEEAENLVLMLNRQFKIGTVTTVQVVASTTAAALTNPIEPPAAVPSAEAGAVTGTAEAEKPRRGRPSKAEAAAKAAAQPAAAATPSPEPLSQPVAAGEAKGHSVDELRAGLQKFTVKNGLPKGKELLNSFGCERVTELAEKEASVQADFLMKCEG